METTPKTASPTSFAIPPNCSPTVWEVKDRAGLLAIETEVFRQKRLIAEDPNTTGAILDKMTDEFNIAIETWSLYEYKIYALLAEAILAHPNTPPDCSLCLIGIELLHSYRVFCCNPSVPFFALEVPDFWFSMEFCCLQLLREEMLPPVAVNSFSRSEDETIAEAAHLHIATAGPIKNPSEGKTAVRATAFPQYDARHLPPFDLFYLREKGTSYEWMDRLYAALHLPLTNEPIPEAMGEPWSRSPLDLMYHLARDGNRLVRWAAQTRLADPDFVFTWDE